MWYDAIVTGVLKSPLHGMMSGSVMLITYKGRKSGNTYTTPVEYLRIGGALSLISQRDHVWWRNLIGANGNGVPITVYLQGREAAATARAIQNEAELTQELLALYHARPAYAKYLHIALDAQGEPLPDALARAAQEYVVVRVWLDQTL